jgi:hypothetical protein
MQIFFLDESGTPPSPDKLRDKYFVVGGLVIPDGVWGKTRDALVGMKLRRGIVGELKWRYFAPNNHDAANPVLKMDQEKRNEIRTELYQIICGNKSIKAIACVSCIEECYKIGHIRDCDDLYHFTYKPLSERFQYHLQDISRTVGRPEPGIIVADHRGSKPDARFRKAHESLLNPHRIAIRLNANVVPSPSTLTSNYDHLVESLFFLPSDTSVGIQLADMVAGAVWRKFEKGDDFWYRALEPSLRKSPAGDVEGYGIVKQPKSRWK